MKIPTIILLFICSWHMAFSSSLQPDSTVFRRFAMTHIQPMPDFYAMQSIFRYWQLQDKSEDDNAQKNIMFWWPDNLYTSPGYAITGCTTKLLPSQRRTCIQRVKRLSPPAVQEQDERHRQYPVREGAAGKKPDCNGHLATQQASALPGYLQEV